MRPVSERFDIDITVGENRQLLEISPFENFDAAARAILKSLYERLGFDLWMVTRTEGDDWIVLQAEDHGYGVKEGAVFHWADSFCSRMVLGQGPCIAPRSREIEAYASAPIGRRVDIGAYIGIPLSREDGSLFGTLCAIHPTPREEAILAELPSLELLGRLLCSLLAAELRADEQARRAERIQLEALTESLTGLYNRRGWERLLNAEENRCRRYGHPACVISIDLDGLKRVNDTEGHAKGDELIRRGALAIRSAVREQDIVARLGGDEFVVLGVECDATGAGALLDRVREALSSARVDASAGLASREPGSNLAGAVELADRNMSACKRERRSVGSRTASARGSR